MLKRLIPITLAFACTSSALAQETNFNYSEFSIGIGKTSIDDVKDDLFMTQLNASIELTDNIFLLGKYQSASKNNTEISGLSNVDADVETSQTQLGVGAAFPVANKVDLFGTLNIISTSAEICAEGICADADDDGYSASVGAKAWLTNQFDLSAEITHYELDETNENDSFYELQAGFWPAQQHRISASFIKADESDTVSINYTFSPKL